APSDAPPAAGSTGSRCGRATAPDTPSWPGRCLLLQLTVGPVRLLLQRQHRGRQAPGQTKGLPFRRAERHPAVEHRIVQAPRYGRGRRGASVHDLRLRNEERVGKRHVAALAVAALAMLAYRSPASELVNKP